MTSRWSRRSLITLVACCAAATAGAGEIHGEVPLGEAAEAEDVVVYLRSVPGTWPAPSEAAALSQKGARFSPAVLPVLRGTRVDLTNDDRVTHSVFSKSDTQPFDLGLYKRGEKKLVAFEKTGVVEIFCSIHPRMNASVLVLDNPFWARPDEAGRFSLANVPAGKYELIVFRRGADDVKVDVKVPQKGAVKLKLPRR